MIEPFDEAMDDRSLRAREAQAISAEREVRVIRVGNVSEVVDTELEQDSVVVSAPLRYRAADRSRADRVTDAGDRELNLATLAPSVTAREHIDDGRHGDMVSTRTRPQARCPPTERRLGVAPSEPELERRFGAAYADYRARVPMFIPRLRRYRAPGAPSNPVTVVLVITCT